MIMEAKEENSKERIALVSKLQGKSRRDHPKPTFNFFFFAASVWRLNKGKSNCLEKRKLIDIVDKCTCSAVLLLCNKLGKVHEI